MCNQHTHRVDSQGEFLSLATKKFLTKGYLPVDNHVAWWPPAAFLLCILLFPSQLGSQGEILIPHEIIVLKPSNILPMPKEKVNTSRVLLLLNFSPVPLSQAIYN